MGTRSLPRIAVAAALAASAAIGLAGCGAGGGSGAIEKQGTYVVGEDIDAGKWTFQFYRGDAKVVVYEDGSQSDSQTVKPPKGAQEVNKTLSKGNVLEVEDGVVARKLPESNG